MVLIWVNSVSVQQKMLADYVWLLIDNQSFAVEGKM